MNRFQASPSLAPLSRFNEPTTASPSGRSLWVWIWYLVICLAAFPVLRWVSLPDVRMDIQALAYILFLVCTRPVISYMTRKQQGLPVFPIICLVYAFGYALPVFYVPSLVISTSSFGYTTVSDDNTLRALGLSLIGVASMQGGFWFFKYSMLNLLIPKVDLRLDSQKAQTLAEVVGFFGTVLLWMGMTGRITVPFRFFAIFVVLTKLSYLCLALLYWYYCKGELSQRGKLSLVGMLFMLVMLGLAMGNMRNFLDPGMTIAAVYWMVKRRFPWKFMVVGALLFAIIQPIKGEYRAIAWKEGYAQTSIVDRVTLWWDLVRVGWSTFHSQGGDAVETVTRGSLARTDLIHMFGHVLDLTPRQVPFQNGSTYSYLLYALVPRAIWSNKPSAQTANEFFGVSYNFQSPLSIGTTSIGAPHLVEAFVNFGTFGVFFVMMLLGMVYAAIDRAFNHAEAGEGGVAVYSVVMGMLILIETALAPTFGALLQTILICVFTLRLARPKRGPRLEVV